MIKDVRDKIERGKKTRTTTKDSARGTGEIVRLVEKAGEGDIEAFGELYEIYVERIYRYVFYQIKEKMMAEDITEEVFIKAWRAIGSCKGKEHTFSAWLYRIAHNQTIDSLRREQRYSSIDIENLNIVDDTVPKAEEILEQQELLNLIDRLPQNQRRVVTLKFIEGMENNEIGQIMGKSQGAVRILQMRALATLRQKLCNEK